MEEKAHEYIDLGLKVLPIKPGAKTPLTTHGVKDATDDHEKVHEWWAKWPDANVAIATGHGVDVIDLDGWDAQDHFDKIKDTPIILGAVMTPRDGGLHLYTTVTGKGNRAGILPGIDYRGNGGYVVAPPSKIIANGDHDYAGEYSWVDDLDFSRATDQAVEWMPEKEKANAVREATPVRHLLGDHKEDDQVRSYLESAIAQEVEKISLANKGERNHVLNTAAFSLGQLTPHYLDAIAIKEILVDAAKAIGLPMAEILKTVDHAISDGAKEPRQPHFHDLKPDVEELTLNEWISEYGDHGLIDNDDLEAIWTLRPELDHIRKFSLARMVSPWAVLGVVIMRVLASAPPRVLLPPIIGGKASLNAFLAIVGPSGSGKDAALACGTECFKIMENGGEYKVRNLPLGTGEGLVDQYARIEPQKDDQGKTVYVQVAHDDQRALFTSMEVNMIKALTNRSSSTLMDTLKQAFNGGQLGFGYRNLGKGSPVLQPGTYRLCMIIGAQPLNIEPLLDDANGGFPQRLIWLPSTDPNITDDDLDEPEPWILQDQHWFDQKELILAIPQKVRKIIRRERAEQNKKDIDDEDDLRGHFRQVQLKVAIGLMIMSGRRTMLDEDWDLADLIMKKSLQTREKARSMIKRKHNRAIIAAHQEDAVRQTYIEKAKFDAQDQHEQTKQDKVKDKIKRVLTNGSMTTRDLQRKVQSPLYKECVADMENDHEVMFYEERSSAGRMIKMVRLL